MALWKYDKAHMDLADQLAGRRSPWPREPFTMGGRRTGGSLFQNWRAVRATVSAALWCFVLKAFLGACRLARAIYPNPRIGRWIVVTRDKDVRDVLKNSDTFSVPYTPEMTELAGGISPILGKDGLKHERLSNLLRRAMHEVQTANGQSMNDLIRSQSAEVANALLDNAAGRIDVITDLLTRTFTETTCTYFGFTVDNPVEFARWTMALSWLLFGDPTGNPEVRREAMNAAPRLCLVIDQAILAAQDAARDPTKKPHGLIRTLVDFQNSHAGESGQPLLTNDSIRATVVGLIVALIPTNTLAAGNMLEELLRPKRRAQWREAIRLAKSGDDRGLKNLLLEAGRLRPALSPGLWRYVRKNGAIAADAGWWRRRKVRPNDVVLAVIPSALRDRRAYPHRPNGFETGRPQYPDLMFGHGPHYCIGNRLAMIQITQIFKALLAREPELATRGRKAKQIGPFPIQLDMKYSPDHTQSTMIIITIPTARNYTTAFKAKEQLEQLQARPKARGYGWCYKARKEEIEQAIAKLGNPAGGKIRESLDGTGVVHFASISVVEANEAHSKPPILLLEINADGPSDDVLKTVVDECFDWLMPVFCYVTERVRNDRRLLFELLKMNSRELKCSPFDPLGLHFNGMKQHSVRDIDRQNKLANFAREALDRHLRTALDGIGRASGALNYVRDKIRKSRNFRGDLFQPSRKTLEIGRWRAPRFFAAPFFTNVWRTPAVLAAIAMFFALWAGLAFTFCHVLSVLQESAADEGTPSRAVAWGWTMFVALIGSLLATVILTVFVLVVLAMLLRWHERTDKSVDRQNDLLRAKAIVRGENQPGQTQNHIIAVMPLKRGWFRRLTLAFSLWGIKQSLFWFRPGFVVTMGTIHYAKWFVIPGTDRFVFMANYDGSWESYLEDFITRAHEGQSAAWSNGVGFPMTRWLIYYGAEDGDRFKRWVRNQQRSTLFWYCRFPQLSADQIRKNALIQDGLVWATTSTESRAWLSSFGSEQRQEGEIETDEVQSLVFSGFPQSYFMTCLFLRAPTDPDGRRKWLRGLTGQSLGSEENDKRPWMQWNRDLKLQVLPRNLRLSFGDHNASGGTSILAFTAAGLSKMGLRDPGEGHGATARNQRPDIDQTRNEDGTGICSFPPVFRMGMVNRKNILGDRGVSDPAGWIWRDGPVDDDTAIVAEGVLLVYGPSPDKVDNSSGNENPSFGEVRRQHREAVQQQKLFLEHCGGSVIKRTETGPDVKAWDQAFGDMQRDGPRVSPIEREHFGFRDGISQPAIRGTTRAISLPSRRDIVAPGEFILGYRNNQDYFPPAFIVRASDDLHNKLPTISANSPLRFPHFGRHATSSDGRSDPAWTDAMADYRDFGRNGTFLVLRDLEQDVEGFENFTKQKADEINNAYRYLPNLIGRTVDAQWVAAKMIGRWQDGAPLIGNPNREPQKREAQSGNDFAYGTDDPRGLHCPLGAHIRRTNPRDSLQPDDPLEQIITNRHRLIRRGRTYVNAGDIENETGTKGMIFACLCADLERQFEFVQQSWAASPCFHGLHNEPDPLIGGKNAKEAATSEAVFSVPTAGGAVTIRNVKSYVTTRAGGYFFMPSRSALHYLSTLDSR